MFHVLQVVDADNITTGDEEEPALDYRDYKKRAAKAASIVSLSCSRDPNIHSYQAEALYTPSFYSSLFSISILDLASFTAIFGDRRCPISEPLSDTIIQGRCASNLYVVSTMATTAAAATAE